MLAYWFKKIKYTFKKRKQVRRNPLNENIFEYWGKIDETL